MKIRTPMLRAAAAFAVVGALAFAVGCDSGRETTKQSITEQVSGAITLSPFATCDDVEAHLKGLAKEQVELMYTNYSNGCWDCAPPMAGGGDVSFDDGAEEPTSGAPQGGEGGEGGEGGGSPAGEGVGGDSNGGSDGGESGGKSVVGTNNQEAGVDEGDIVKTDGEYVYVLRDRSFFIVDAWPADEAELVSTTVLPGYGAQLFVQDDVAAVFSTAYWWDLGLEPPTGTHETGLSKGEGLTMVTLYDISDRTAPAVVRSFIAEGNFVQARMVGTTARIVLRTPVGMGWGYYYGGGAVSEPGVAVGGDMPSEFAEADAGSADSPSSGGGSAGSEGSAGKADGAREPEDREDPISTEPTEPTEDPYAEMKAQALAAIDATTLADWLPRVWHLDADGQLATDAVAEPLSACGDIFEQSVAGGLGFLSIITLDLSAPETPVPAVSLIGDGHLIYGSATSLYVASDVYNSWLMMYPDKEEDWQVTAIHRFDIAAQGTKAAYVASGKVPGHILNQFAMSEWQGNLRVASTKEAWWGGDGQTTSENFVSVLAPGAGELQIIGQIDGIAEGERIYSARMIEDKGYVVTFVQVDPLFTLDLSDPTAPAIVGELKVPGFSTYIHPMADGNLLTIGQETTDNGDWVGVEGMKLEIFDVSDFADPQSVQKYVFEGGYYSEALYEHKAFSYHPAKQLLAIPVDGYGWGGGDVFMEEGDEWQEPEYKVGLGVFEVDTQDGIVERGYIDHNDLKQQSPYYYESVRRSVFIGDFVYSVGLAGLKVSGTEDLVAVASVVFPAEEYWDGGGKGEPMPDGGPAWDGAEPDEAPPPDSGGDPDEGGSDDAP
jgi:hypothetical protein